MNEQWQSLGDLALIEGDEVWAFDFPGLRFTFLRHTHVYEFRSHLGGYYGFDRAKQVRRISCATPAPLPRHKARLPSGEVVDLTQNTEAQGLMHPDKRKAMEAHGGPYERFFGAKGWEALIWQPSWVGSAIYRVAPAPAAPREGWVAVLYPSARDCKVAHPGAEPVFVRVVEERE